MKDSDERDSEGYFVSGRVFLCIVPYDHELVLRMNEINKYEDRPFNMAEMAWFQMSRGSIFLGLLREWRQKVGHVAEPVWVENGARVMALPWKQCV